MAFLVEQITIHESRISGFKGILPPRGHGCRHLGSARGMGGYKGADIWSSSSGRRLTLHSSLCLELDLALHVLVSPQNSQSDVLPNLEVIQS